MKNNDNKFFKKCSKIAKEKLRRKSTNFFYCFDFAINAISDCLFRENCHVQTQQEFLRSSEIDKIYETVIKNRTYYTYNLDRECHPYDIENSKTQFISYGNHFRRGFQCVNSDSVKTNYRIFSTKLEIENMFLIFGDFLNNNDELTKKCKKMIDLKQFILVLILFGNDVENFSSKKTKKAFEKLCPDTFQFCGFSCDEWDKFVSDKSEYDVYDFINIFNDFVYALYADIQSTVKNNNGIIASGIFKDLNKDVKIFYKLENILHLSNEKCNCVPTFIPQDFEWFHELAYADSIYC
jgi:hypothetical protein